jgi:hypothetical protein
VPELRNRVKEFKTVKSEELTANPANWRTHPYAQKKALDELLDSIGIAGALTAYVSERNGGKLTLIDGHERMTHQAEWPVLILDVNDDEADKLLLTLDPIAGLAESNAESLQALLAKITPDGAGTEALYRELRLKLENSEADDDEGVAEAGGVGKTKVESTGEGPPEMALQPFEHYDYVMVCFKNSLDFLNVAQRLGLKKVKYTMKDGVGNKVGLCRVVDGATLLEKLK